MSRWIKLHCQLANHDLWLAEPFSRGQAWVDLLMLAQSKPGWIIVRGISIELARGQVGHSELTLASRWKWSRSRVRLFIDSLRKRQMVDVHKDNKTTIISIINFDTYQSKPTADSTAEDTADHTAEGHQKDSRKTLTRKKERKTEEGENKKDISATPKKKCPASYSEEFEVFWSLYPSRNGQKAKKAKAWESFWKITNDSNGISPDILIDRIKILAPTYGDFPRDAVTWLNQRGWEDEARPTILKQVIQGNRQNKAQVLQDQNIAAMNEWLASKGVQQ